ncbi:hypothetical protein F441_15891, partial [Phytophthora nicotianae CJ01A1]
MGATFPDENALVIDLAAPFGWSGSPAFYGAFGRAISWLVGTNSPASVSTSEDDELFFGYEWVDDHILIEPDRDSRLELAESTLRLSMMAVLGPDSINDAKFSGWSTQLQTLGLIWDTTDRTVSMPAAKIHKCLDRVVHMLTCEKVTKKHLQKLLGAGARALEEDLQRILRELQSSSLAASSRQRYLSSWNQWTRWCASMEYSPWLPEDPALSSRQLVLFTMYCYKYGSDSSSVRGNSLQTIQSKISAVAWYHRCEYGVNIGLLPHHAMAIKEIHRLRPSPRPKLPITVSNLRILHQQLNFHSAHDRVLWGATVMGFFFLLRRSEYLLHDNKIYQFAIRRSDIKFYDQAGTICEGKAQVQRVEINFHGGKNDQAGVVEHHRTVSEDPDELLCK